MTTDGSIPSVTSCFHTKQVLLSAVRSLADGPILRRFRDDRQYRCYLPFMYMTTPAIPSATITNAKVSVSVSMMSPFVYVCKLLMSCAWRLFNKAEVAAPNASRRGQDPHPPVLVG